MLLSGLDNSGLWNMDQTMVRFDSPSNRTNNTTGESRIRITNTGVAKRGFTVALCISASGEKLPAFVIFKERSGGLPRRVAAALNVPSNVVVTGNKNGWMTAPLLKDWIRDVFLWHTDGRKILLLDQYRPHHTDEIVSFLTDNSTIVMGIPSGNMKFINSRLYFTCSTS